MLKGKQKLHLKIVFELITFPDYLWTPDGEKSSSGTSGPDLSMVMPMHHMY